MFRVALFIFFTIQSQHDATASFHSQLVPIEYKIICKGGVFDTGIWSNNKKIKCNSTITDAEALEFKQAEQVYNETMKEANQTLHKANETLFNTQLQLGSLALEMQGMLEKWRPPKLLNIFSQLSRKNAVNFVGDVLLNGNGDLVTLRRPVGKRKVEVGQKRESDREVRYIHISNPDALERYRQKYAQKYSDDGGDLIKLLKLQTSVKKEKKVAQKRESDRDVRYIHISNPEALERYRQKYAEKYSDDDGGDVIKVLKLQASVKKEKKVGQKRESDRDVRYIHISNPEALERYRQKYADTQSEESEESKNLRCGCNNGKQSLQSLLDSLRSAQKRDGSPPIARCNCGRPQPGALRNRRKDGPLPSRSLDRFSGERGDSKMDIDFIVTNVKEKDIGDWDNGSSLEKIPKKPKRQDNWDSKPKDKWEDPRPKGGWGAKISDDYNSHSTRWRPKVNRPSDPSPKKPSSNSGGGGGGWGQYKNLKIEPKLHDDIAPPKRNRNSHLNKNVQSNYNQFGRTPIPYVGKKRIYDVDE